MRHGKCKIYVVAVSVGFFFFSFYFVRAVFVQVQHESTEILPHTMGPVVTAEKWEVDNWKTKELNTSFKRL